MPLCKEFEEKMIKYLWRTRAVSSRPASSTFPTAHYQQQQYQHHISPSETSRDQGSQTALDEKTSADGHVPTEAVSPPQRYWWNWKLQPRPSTATNANPSTSSDPEKGGKRTERKLVMIGPIYAGCGAALAACWYKFRSFPCFLSCLLFLLVFPFLFFNG